MSKYEEEREENLIAYRKLRKEILQKYKGRYIAIVRVS